MFLNLSTIREFTEQHEKGDSTTFALRELFCKNFRTILLNISRTASYVRFKKSIAKVRYSIRLETTTDFFLVLVGTHATI